jgi:glutamate-1-semialdehyde 2,1-aminomutase
MGAGGGIPAEKEFLKALREFCDEKGILLVLDEVITGFRLAPGGAQQYFGIKADIIVFGKILGGGFPVGAFCGKREIMEKLNSRIYERPKYVFHGGTFTANPITMTAGLTTLKILQDGSLIDKLNKTGDKIRNELHCIFETAPVNAQVLGVASLFGVHFTKEKIKNARAIPAADKKKLMDYHLRLIANGVFFLPTHIGALSTAHSEDDIEKLFLETENYIRQSLEVNVDVF